jgi:hypothetical protein
MSTPLPHAVLATIYADLHVMFECGATFGELSREHVEPMTSEQFQGDAQCA